MKKRVLRLLGAFTLALSLVGMTGFAAASAAPAAHSGVTPNVPECSGTRLAWVQGPTPRVWTDTGNLSNYNQRLTVELWQARDNVDNVYCNEMFTSATLRYHLESRTGEVNAAAINYFSPNQAEYDTQDQNPNLSQTFETVEASTKAYPLVVPCAYAVGEWYVPGQIDISLRVPASGYFCAP